MNLVHATMLCMLTVASLAAAHAAPPVFSVANSPADCARRKCARRYPGTASVGGVFPRYSRIDLPASSPCPCLSAELQSIPFCFATSTIVEPPTEFAPHKTTVRRELSFMPNRYEVNAGSI